MMAYCSRPPQNRSRNRVRLILLRIGLQILVPLLFDPQKTSWLPIINRHARFASNNVDHVLIKVGNNCSHPIVPGNRAGPSNCAKPSLDQLYQPPLDLTKDCVPPSDRVKASNPLCDERSWQLMPWTMPGISRGSCIGPRCAVTVLRQHALRLRVGMLGSCTWLTCGAVRAWAKPDLFMA